MKEHYGITLSAALFAMLRRVMLNIYDKRREKRIEKYPTLTGRDCVIAETDGSMVPIVVTDENAKDRRTAAILNLATYYYF